MTTSTKIFRAFAVWACLVGWLLLNLQPIVHVWDHENDHVHVGGAIIPIEDGLVGEMRHRSPSDLFEELRTEGTLPLPADERHGEHDEPSDVHGFDSLAHFAASPLLVTAHVIAAAFAPALEAPPAPLESASTPTTRPHSTLCIRGPPAR